MAFGKSDNKAIHSVGISIQPHVLEGALYNRETNHIIRSVNYSLPQGVITSGGDMVPDAKILAELFKILWRDLNPPNCEVHLSVPSTLLRVVELPKMEREEYYISLASEAERFRAFDNTEAIVEFEPLEGASSPSLQRLVFSAIRKDSYQQYRAAAKLAKIKLAGMALDTVQVFRAFMGTGVLEGIIEQVGHGNFVWGSIMQEFDRLRFLLWRGNKIIEIREVTMSGQLLDAAQEDSLILADLITEVRRTVQAAKIDAPLFWLTSRLSFVVVQVLQQALQVPVQSIQYHESLQVDRADISLAVIGTCMASFTNDPFRLNLLEQSGFSQSDTTGGAGGFSSGYLEGIDLNYFKKIGLPSLAGCLVLVVGVWFLLLTFNQIQIRKLKEITSLSQGNDSQLEQLRKESDQLKQTYDLNHSILDVASQSKQINQVALALLNDLQRLTPNNMWFSDISFDKELKINGFSLTHKEIIEFTEAFEQKDYAQDIVIHHINERIINGNRAFDFTLAGLSNVGNLMPVAEADTAAVPADEEAP
jgi:Fimbrial assembly protein (PilN)